LASVILPRPDSDLKTELNFSVNDSNTDYTYAFARRKVSHRENPFKDISAQKTLQQTKDSKAARPILQGQNPPRLVIGDSLLVIV
jgi:hypothetical protein